MKTKWILYPFTALLAFSAQAVDQSIHMNSSAIQGWATGYQHLSYGADVTDDWKTPQKALGHATDDAFDIVSLGNGGQITMTFSQGISNGSGYDFAVFENGFSDTFLELGWVEVSSDGVHFVRFYNLSLNSGPIGMFGTVDPSNITGLASKYRQGYGTQFDLQFLQDIYSNQNDPLLGLTSSFKSQLHANFPYLDLNNIRYVRIIDIIGSKSSDDKDAAGNTIYDPYPTTLSAGFDLDAIAVLHEGTVPLSPFALWAANRGLSGDPSADTDSDGSPDLEEYFFGTSPTNQSDVASFSSTLTDEGLQFLFLRNPDAAGTVEIETVSALTQTNWSLAVPVSVSSNNLAGSIEVKMILPATNGAGFYRLRFEGAAE